MIWLASFPRAGNTFFRNVLYEVYGIESSTFHREPGRAVDENYEQYQVVKTHLLPNQLEPSSPDIKSVYIIRDGRDSLVSIAHHRKDIIEPGSDFYNNLLEAILALGGSFFGGWSENVRQWTERADVVIRFEDLVKDPIPEVEKLRAIMDLPEPQLDKLPTFKDLKFGNPKYGAGHGKNFNKDIRQKNFRKGKVGSYKEEMPAELEELFWQIHGGMMEQWNYTDASSSFIPNPNTYKVLIEVSKIFTRDNDGVKRYLIELIEHLLLILQHKPNWQVDFFYQNKIKSIQSLRADIEEKGLSNFNVLEQLEEEHNIERVKLHEYESGLLGLKARIKETLPGWLYAGLSYPYRKGPFRAMLRISRELTSKKKAIEIRNANIERFNSYDLIHVPLPQHLVHVSHLDTRFLVTVHDLTHKLLPEFHKEDNIRLAEKGMSLMLKKKADMLAISGATRKDLLDNYKVTEEKIHLVLEAASKGKFNRDQRKRSLAPVREKYNLPEGTFLLCLSTLEPRKNLPNTIKAFLKLIAEYPELEAQLVICGKKGWKIDELFENESLQSDRIHFTGFVDDDDLPLLYAHARALCYVSHYEGFGLPLLEAMSCGTPVIYGNNSSMPEVAGEGGLPADANQVDEIKNQMYRLLSDDALHQEKARLAWEHANTFSWLKAALQTLKVYEKIIDRS